MTDPGLRGNRRVAVDSGVVPSDPATPGQPQSSQQRSGRRARWPWILGGVAALGLLAASWFALPIRQIGVSGNRQLPAGQVKALAGATPGFGWLYYGHWRAQKLLDNPWVQSAVVTRHYPDSVTVAVTERRPVARWQAGSAGGGRLVTALAADGTAMPGAPNVAGLPLLSGWGPDRRADALRVLSALSGYNVQSVTYTPAGLRVKLPTGSVWSGDLNSLLKYAGSIGMYPNKNLSIYPWGVSVQE